RGGRRSSGRLERLPDGHQQLADSLRQRADLRLLQAQRDDGAALTSLQEEGSAPGLTNCAGHEAIRLVEEEEATRHDGMLQAGCARDVRGARKEKAQTEGIGEVPALRSLSPVIPRLGRRPRDVCPPNRVVAQPKGTEPHLSILN